VTRRPLAFGVTLALAGLLACGSFGEAPSQAGVQPGAEGGAEAGLTDAQPAGPDGGTVVPTPPRACAVGKGFGAPHEITSAGTRVEAARFSTDRKTAYLSLCASSVTKTTCDLFTAAVDGETIGTPVLHALSTSIVYDTNLVLSPDSSVAIFASGRVAPGDQIYTALFDAKTGQYGSVARLALPKNPTATAFANEPYLLRDGKTLYFSAAPTSGTDWDLYRANGEAPGYDSGNAKVLAGNANSGNEDVAPVVTEDEEELFFATNRSGLPFDVWTATKTSGALPGMFDSPDIVGVLKTDNVEYPTWISPDACALYFIRKTTASAAGGALWVATR